MLLKFTNFNLFTRRSALILAAVYACFLIGCAKSVDIRDEIKKAADSPCDMPPLYVLEFDHDGNLISAEEPARAIRDLVQRPDIDRLVVMSLGWAHSRDTLAMEYRDLLNRYYEWKQGHENRVQSPNTCPSSKSAILAISWESSLSGFGKFIGDVIPLPNNVVDAFGKPLLPFTYWAKARLADKIGFGDLKETVAEILGQVKKRRNARDYVGLYGIGHSFGARIITGLFNAADEENKKLPDNAIKGGILIEPALSSFELHSLGSRANDKPAYPLLVTSSRHDHANRHLFPLANIPLNSAYLRFSGELFKPALFGNKPASNSFSNAYDYLLFPAMPVYSALVLVDSYLFGQIGEIRERTWRYLPDTLAQLPIVELPVSLINAKFNPTEPDDYWGRRHKGLFHLGAMHESAATIVTEDTHGVFYGVRTVVGKIFNRELAKTARIYPITNQARVIESQDPLPKGIIPIDMSEEIDTGAFGEDLSVLYNYAEPLFGWLDPIGAHNDYKTPEVYELIYRLLEDRQTN